MIRRLLLILFLIVCLPLSAVGQWVLPGVSTGIINLSNPVNRQHPLNRGRVAWWLGLPGKTGGHQFYDLMGLNHASLLNLTGSVGWTNQIYPGALGQSLYGANYGASTTSQIVMSGAGTIAIWVNFTSTSGYPLLAGSFGTGSGSIRNFGLSGYNGQLYFAVATSSTEYHIVSGTVSTNVWYRIVGTYDGTNSGNALNLYVNGINIGSAAGPGTPLYTAGGGVFNIAYDTGWSILTAYYNDIPIWNRGLSASEVRQDYILSRQGYPGVINRVTSMLPDLYAQSGGGGLPFLLLYPNMQTGGNNFRQQRWYEEDRIKRLYRLPFILGNN